MITLQTYPSIDFAYETLAGALMHLTILGIVMGILLGVLGGIMGNCISYFSSK